MGNASNPSRADQALAGLKDFQRRTVNYVFDRFYGSGGTSRFLVADEVGLGKTLVARGIIAKTIEHLQAEVPDKRIDVLYVCSNAAIASQNINRLKVSGAGDFAIATRLTYLPRQVHSLRSNPVNFLSLTPGTAFEHARSRGGHAEERAIIYRMLHGMHWAQGKRRKRLRHGLLNMLQATTRRRDSWRSRCRNIGADDIDRDLAVSFRRAVAADGTLYERLKECCEVFHRYRPTDRILRSENDVRLELIGQLRRTLAEVCLTALEPDLVILDEFQRFKQLLDGEDDAALLARALFDHPEVRVLLLSATPYKMFTLDAEMSDEDHYPDFVRTLKFLYNDDETLARAQGLIEARRKTMQEPTPDHQLLRSQSEQLRRTLLAVMCRTERVDTTRDRNAMLAERPMDTPLHPTDLHHAAFADAAARSVGAGDITEYWKSSPYLLNFLKHYDLRRRLDRMASKPPDDLLACMRSPNGHLLRKQTIDAYKQLDPGNARMRALVADTIDRGLWQLLWMPASMPYSRPSGPYEGMSQATKALVFSAWTAVPDAIAAVCSYEAERRMVGSPDFRHSQLYDRIKPLLRFARASADNRLTGMPVIAWMMPCPRLARMVDPLRIAIDQGKGEPVELGVLLAKATAVCGELLKALPAGKEGTRPDERWYWAALALIEANPAIKAWCDSYDGWRAATPDFETGTRFHDHVDHLVEAMEGELELGPRPADLAEVIAEIALAAPGTCALRALSRIAPTVDLHGPVMLSSAAKLASGFRSLFNMPETIAMLRGTGEDSYWRRTLKYNLDGNIQAMLDESVHVLPESLGLRGHDSDEVVSAVASHVLATLSLRTAQMRVDELRVAGSEIKVSDFSTRTRFALRFADIRDDNDQALVRADAVRDTFNSPFRPFILASTSIGQEGLDFHTWCHAVVHWNLPSNPVDLEQREGRVHRYKGHAVRKNIAERYGLQALSTWREGGDPWQHMFALAENDRPAGVSDLVPYWVFEEGQARVERRVPLLPFSRDKARFGRLKRGLALYRVVFGQPRQEDLLSHLERNANLSDGDVTDWLISLTPPVDGDGADQAQCAARADWETLPMPQTTRRLPLNLTFTAKEMGVIRQGLVPREMEDKWFIFFENGFLNMHRSWTGCCIYRVQFEDGPDGCRATEVIVNNDPNQYRANGDVHERESLRALISILLLRRPTPYPTSDSDGDAAVLEQWSVMGRAMFGDDDQNGGEHEA